MPNDKNNQKIFNLEERTAKFGEAVIKFCLKIPRNPVTIPIISQLVRSGTAVGALYCEADDAESSKDFIHKLGIGKKEARETKHWLRMMVVANPDMRSEANILLQEAKELHLIFNAIVNKIKNKRTNVKN